MKAAELLVPVALYNLVACTIGASDEPTLDHFVKVPEKVHLKLLSLLQDIVYLESKGAKATPKALCLGLTVQHLTWSTHLLGLLNHLGDCASHSTILSFETALAQLQLNQGMALPPGVEKQKVTILVWDNIDFLEETVSGAGTTHHTNGILIQHGETAGIRPTSRPFIKKKQRSLKTMPSVMLPYQRKKRQGPQILNMDVVIGSSTGTLLKHISRCLDTMYVVMKDTDSSARNLPNWTGFNTLLHDNDDLVKS